MWRNGYPPQKTSHTIRFDEVINDKRMDFEAALIKVSRAKKDRLLNLKKTEKETEK